MRLFSRPRAHKGGLAMVVAGMAVVILSVMPASASSGITVSATCGTFGNMVCTGAAQSAQVGTGTTEDVAMSCTTQAEVAAENTVVSCYLVGVRDGVHYGTTSLALPGTTSTDPHLATGVPVQGYELCIAGGYLTISGTFVAPGGYACSFPLLD